MALTDEQKRKRAEYQRAWRAKHPERWKEIVSAGRAKWKAENRDEHREAQREHRYTVRKEILALLSNGALECNHCAYDYDWRALQIDHINGGGRKDPRTIGGNTNLWAFRAWLKENLAEGKALYQVLCANCNWIKRYENDEVSLIRPGGPHDKSRRA